MLQFRPKITASWPLRGGYRAANMLFVLPIDMLTKVRK
jgi:hypothetical protein